MKTDRFLPQPEQYASCPYDGKILEFYKGQFESVYILLHPFFRLKNNASGLFNINERLGKLDLLQDCEAVSWQSILDSTNLNNISEIDIGLRTNILGLKQEFQNRSYANILNELTKSLEIWQPAEGELSPFIENELFNAIKILGHQWLWVGDEFGTERKLHWIDDLIIKDEIPCHGCIFTHDHSLLITTHWDSHYSLLCSSFRNIEQILAVRNFDGFYCTDETEIFWGVHGI